MNTGEPAPAEYEGMLKAVDQDLELDFIREFSTGGEWRSSDAARVDATSDPHSRRQAWNIRQ
jgi:hypothetical protein